MIGYTTTSLEGPSYIYVMTGINTKTSHCINGVMGILDVEVAQNGINMDKCPPMRHQYCRKQDKPASQN